jgi:hypothetical protein
MSLFRLLSVPASLLFPVDWKVDAIEWTITRVALFMMIAFWLGGCAMGS